ncbi:DUF3800 domain-containing protein [Roseobacter sp. CCS2]|uniref:DUF3800 domain-containing protein n=1 Tax=Roseobacter sp. CCS2 TaxID=391593 RepID=UPI0000F403AF|nr:DUF3800 domain-containing protein [Roseobacter sp. CCS2]EBA14047.1 hypothetical protein RCCS2_09159 [Roseobacter sp. CCS2]
MVDVNDIRNPAIALGGLTGLDRVFTFHYDETNNIRRLHLTPNGLNVRAPQCFVLGGIAHAGLAPVLDFEDLRTAFNLQRSSVELKLKHLGKGDFLALLDAPKVCTFLNWLKNSNAFIHFQVLDPMYWSLVDVIDSIIAEHGSNELIAIAPLLKNDLYWLLRNDPDETPEILGRYTYPDVGRVRRATFIAELQVILKARQDLFPAFNFQMLKGLLQIGARLERLPYLEDERPNVLIDGFGSFYLHRLALFKHSNHILDIEPSIQDFLAGLELKDGEVALSNFSFVDSRSAPWVQVSDVLAGLLGKLFIFASNNDLEEIFASLSGLNGHQRAALDTLIGLVDRSTDECPAFVQYINSLEDQRRLAAIFDS